jgi:hypothetical protein
MRGFLVFLLAVAGSGCGGLSVVSIKDSPGAQVQHVEARSLAGSATATATATGGAQTNGGGK